MTPLYRIALLGFNAFERNTLASYLRLATHRTPRYEAQQILAEADFVVADADHAPSVQLVAATERLGETVFVGAHRPPDARAWLARPLEPLQVMRELDALVAAAGPPPRPPSPPPPQPAAPVPQSTEPALPTARPSPAKAGRRAPPASPTARRALIVDDSDVAQRFLQLRLAAWGLTADCVATSQQALERLQQCGYDFVFLDLELGPASPYDGLGLCQKIKREFATRVPPLLVVAVTAHRGELDRVRATLAGCDGFLGKPLDESELGQLLGRQGVERVPAPGKP